MGTAGRGSVAPGFEDVRGEVAAFLGRVVAEYGDPGAQRAACAGGRQVVELCSGALPGDDLTGVFSVCKRPHTRGWRCSLLAGRAAWD
jgi:hypothetical protein